MDTLQWLPSRGRSREEGGDEPRNTRNTRKDRNPPGNPPLTGKKERHSGKDPSALCKLMVGQGFMRHPTSLSPRKDATKDLTIFLRFETEIIGFPPVDSVLVMVSSVRSHRPNSS